MTNFTINFNTGAGNETASSLEEAKQVALDGINYTQEDVTISDEQGNVVSTAKWFGVVPSEDDEFILTQIGTYGFYQTWSDELE